jgi:two-component system, NtrC family, sensor histidine kinase HydH
MAADSYLEDEERQRLKAEYAEIATLAGGLAHEIKNPLSTILLNLDLLGEELRRSEAPENRRMLNKLGTIQQECGRLKNVLDAFLQFARVGELHLEPADLNRLVREFIEFYQPQAHERGIDISPHLAIDLPLVALDCSLMQQVLMNLALNAEQAMPDGGLLELQTQAADGRVLLDLIDNGRGMDERTMSKAFQIFFSTTRGGSGLGLPTVRRIVEAHRGTITCQSEPGRGTRFTISLPACE